MAVVIRMKRAGAKKRPFYRIVVADSRFARDGRYIEQLGHYDPLTNPAKFLIDKDRFAQWILKGARPSESIAVMMAKHAPESLRPVRPQAAASPEASAEAPAKPKKAKVAAKKAVQKPRVAKKVSDKKAKTRAKAKAKKSTGAAKPKAAKKAKK
jgi:small subunit ribosomal protein S16